MSQNSNRIALGISAACLCAVLAVVVASAHQSGEPQEGAAEAEASQCGGGSSPEAMDAALADAKDQAREQQAASGQDDSGWVVLNNRGYNYGPAPEVAVDMRLFEPELRARTQD